jgi:hypothetical protein
MRKLSSDALYYKGLVGLIIGPVLIVLFVKYIMVHNVPDLFKDFIFFLLLILIATQGRLLFKTRQVFYNNKTVFLETYFTKQLEELQLTDILSLKKAFSLQKERNRNMFKLIYLKGNKKRTIYFLRSLDLVAVDDLEVFIGLDKLAR